MPTMSWRRMARGARPGVEAGRNASLLDESLMPYDVNWLGGSRRYTDEFETFQVFLNKSFFKDLQFLLIGPAWLMHFIYKRLGISY